MRYVKYAFLALLGLLLLTLSLANMGMVTLRLLPHEVGEFLGYNPTVALPLFLVILGGVAAGLLIGFVWEWLREHRYRAAAARAQRQAEQLEAKLGESGKTRAGEADDVLALLDEPERTR